MIVKMSNIRGNLYNRADITREIAGSTASLCCDGDKIYGYGLDVDIEEGLKN